MTRRLSPLVVLAVGGLVLVSPGVAAGGGCIPEADGKMTSSSRPLVGIAECAFRDTVTYIDVGETVRWANKDHVPHSVTGAALSWGTEDLLDMGDHVSYSFEREGVYPYYCVLHPTMVGAVVVGDGINTAALGAGGAAVEKLGDSAPASSTETAPVDDDDGLSPMLVALTVAALGAIVVATRFALTRRAGAPSPS